MLNRLPLLLPLFCAAQPAAERECAVEIAARRESIVLPLAPPVSAADVDQEAINAAIDRALHWLLERQQLDGAWFSGSWTSLAGANNPGLNALATYTLLKSGIDPRHHSVRRALTQLGHAPPAGTYGVACLSMALSATGQREHKGWLTRLSRVLMSSQNTEGDFGYPSGADLSNTQYGALGLRAAAQAGVRIPERVWTELGRAVLRYKSQIGGFGYLGPKQASGSMTTAGVGTLAICANMLRPEKGKPSALVKSFDKSVSHGMGWLARRYDPSSNPSGSIAWQHYYLYGIERVGALTDSDRLGTHDWYGKGARHLLRSQLANGSFQGDISKTCFALLFLRKATVPRTGENHDVQGGQRWVTQAEDAPFTFVASGDEKMSLWIARWDAELRAALEWPGEEGRGARVLRLVYLINGHAVKTFQEDGKQPCEKERFSYQHTFAEPGVHEVMVQIDVLPPRGKDARGRPLASEPRRLQSETLHVHVRNLTPDWMLFVASDPSHNLVPAAEAFVSASSQLAATDAERLVRDGRRARKSPSPRPDGKAAAPTSANDKGRDWQLSGVHSAGMAVDNSSVTSWIADGKDDSPRLSITLQSKQRTNLILLSHARTWPYRSGVLARALEVEVVINGMDHQRVRMSSDARRKGRLRLRRSVEIESLELILHRIVPGADGNRYVGLSEVELQFVDGSKGRRQ